MVSALGHLAMVAMLAQSAAPPAAPPVMRPAPPAQPLQPAPPAQPAPAPPAPAQPAPAQPAPSAPARPPEPVPPETGSQPPAPAPPTGANDVVPGPPPQPVPAPPPPGYFLPGAPPPQPAPPPEAPQERRYGDQGRSELGLGLGYTQQTGFVGQGGYRYFVVDGVAPGFEGTVQSHDGRTTGFLLGSLRVAPVRTSAAALVLTARAGRVLMSGHDDGWGAGGGAGVIFFLSPNMGVEVSYAVLWLLPDRFCADLPSCTIKGPDLGLRFGF